MKKKILDEICSAVGMACIFNAFLLHGCGLYVACAVDLAIGCIAWIAPIKRERRADRKRRALNLQGVKKG